jgi:mRNA interferase MazF
MEFHQRDIVLAHFPFTDLSQTKLRPALIISAEAVNHSFDFVCVQITPRTISDSLYLKLEEDMIEGSLLLVSGIRLHKIFCLNKKIGSP